jgi:multimeric flavodoxin WrbA
MEKVKIMGISGSPRHGNTEFLVKEALKAAQELGDVEVEFIGLAGKNIRPCRADYLCFKRGTRELPCPSIDDDANEILKKMFEVDGFIVGSPVYYGGMTAQLKALFDRSMVHEVMGLTLRSKVLGSIAVSYERNGGQECTVSNIIHWGLTHDMIIVGVGPDRPAKTGVGAFLGGIAHQGFPYPIASPTKEGHTASRKDEIGLNSVIGVGKRVAEVAKMIKFANSQIPESKLGWPSKPSVELVDLYMEAVKRKREDRTQ